MKKKIRIIDCDSSTTSIIKMKDTGKKKKFKLINENNWTERGKVRMTLVKNTALGDESKVVIENDSYTIEIDFSTLCDIKDILSHVDDFKENNWFGKTKVVKK